MLTKKFCRNLFTISLSLLLILIDLASGQLNIQWHLVEECPNNTVVAELYSIPSLSSRGSGVFSLLSLSELFYIETGVGRLRTKHRIDRETICDTKESSDDCKLRITIMYQSRSSSSKPIIISAIVYILDINDNAPVWNTNEISLEILEHSPINSDFRIPEAIDPDRGPDNTTKKYYILKTENSENYFDIKFINEKKPFSKSGKEIKLVVLQDIDREKQAAFKIVIVAEDGGEPPLSNQLTVNIIVNDINDHPPKFKTKSPVRIELPENTPVNSRIARFEAEDIDSEDANKLRYLFSRTVSEEIRQLFWLKEREGDLILQRYVDYEIRSHYSFSVEVTDGKFQSSIDIEIKVLNVNDNVPKISIQPLNGNEFLVVRENQKRGEVIGAVTVSDDDDKTESLQIFCKLDTNELEIQPVYDGAKNNFLLVSAKEFDREVKAYFVFTITCLDSGEPVQSSSITSRLHILDENDNKPMFLNSPMKASVRENMPVGTVVYHVRAQDGDSKENADFRFFIESDSESYFAIDNKSGVITTKKVFDAEENPSYQIMVSVSDRRDKFAFTTKGLIDLTIDDVNDHSPRFDRDVYHFIIYENVKTGTKIGKVDAKDSDISNRHNTVKYNFKPGTESSTLKHISVTKDGNIYVKSSHLDREVTSSFTFYIIASDNGIPSLSSSAYVQIEVKDINDNAPEWIYPDSPTASINITYRMPVGQEITRFEAKDQDYGKNSELEYFFASNTNNNGIFQLQPSTGVLYVARTLTPHDVRSYTMVIGVKDHGPNSMIAHRTFKVNIVHNLDESKSGFALFGRFEGDLLIILILVIITLVICMGLISAIWFLKCGSRAARCLQGGRLLREHMRPPDGHSPSQSNEVLPMFIGRRHDSFISNMTKTTYSDRIKSGDSFKDGSQPRLSPAQAHCLNNKADNHYQCLRHMKGSEHDRSILTRRNSITEPQSSTSSSKTLKIQPGSATPTVDARLLTKSQTLPKDMNVTVPSSSQLSVRWLDKHCEPNDDEEYQICISNRSTPKFPIIRISRSPNPDCGPTVFDLKDSDYTQLSSTTTFKSQNCDSNLPMSYV